MFVLEDLGWATLATVLFILFHFIFERGIRLKKVVSMNIKFWNIEIISGLYYSLISLSIQLLIWNFDGTFAFPIGVAISVVLITIRTSVSSVINLIPSMVFFILTYDISILTYVIYIVAFIGMITHEIARTFLKKNFIVKAAMILSIITSALIAFFIYLGTNNFLDMSVYQATLIQALIEAYMLAIVSYFISFSKSANILFDSVTYTYHTYFRHAVGIFTIQNMIKNDAYKTGLFIVFKHTYTKELTIQDEKEIRASFLTDIEKLVPAKSILFFIQENMHGLFIPINFVGDIKKSLSGNEFEIRNDDDYLKGIERLFTNSQKYYHTTNGEIAGIKINVGVSIYGIQDSSLSKLEQNATFALNSFNSKSINIISLFNPKKMKEVIIDSKKLIGLDQALKLDNFENKFRGIYSSEKKGWFGAQSVIINNSEFNLMHSVREHVKFNNWIEEFDRYFAINTLQSFENNIQKVFFDYSPIIKTKNIDILDIKNKISQLGINYESVIFVLDEEPKLKYQQDNINLFKQEGFKIAFSDIINQKIIDKIQPDFILISPKNFEETINFDINKIVYCDIRSEESMQIAIKKGAKLYAGELISEEASMKNFDIFSKQSKIYLVNLLNSNS